MCYEPNKIHVCVHIALELYTCIVKLCTTKNAVKGYTTEINQERAKIIPQKTANKNLHTLPQMYLFTPPFAPQMDIE
jgi:hypothetical protein